MVQFAGFGTNGVFAGTGGSVITGLDESFGTDGWALTPLSAKGGDRFRAVTVSEDGQVYAAGFLTEDGDQVMALAKISSDGALDESFGTGGFASLNVTEGGTTGELASGLAVQSTGKIVIGGPTEHD